MIKRSPHISCRKSAFTLLEVLIAVAIFSICMTVVYTTFRTSSKAFEAGRKEAETMQTMRFTISQVSKDLKSIYFETDYNSRFNYLENLAHQNGFSNALLGNAGAQSDEKDKEENDLNKTYIGQKLDLHFKGVHGEQNDIIDFAHFLPSDGTFDNSFLGAERVQYYVEKDSLYRQRSRVVKIMRLNPDIDKDGGAGGNEAEAGTLQESDYGAMQSQFGAGSLMDVNPARKFNYFAEAKEELLPPELLAEHVTEFHLKYGYFSVGQWTEADDWDSDSKEHRSPKFQMDESDPSYLSKKLMYMTRPNDCLPSFVHLRMAVQQIDPKTNEAKGPVRHIDSITWLSEAEETFNPADEDYFKNDPKAVQQNNANGNPLTAATPTPDPDASPAPDPAQ